MKKRTVRLLAMLLCVMSFVALLPSAALAANDTDSVKEIAANVVKELEQAANDTQVANKAREKYSYTLKVPKNSRVNLVDFNYYRHGTSAYPFPVRFIWYCKKHVFIIRKYKIQFNGKIPENIGCKSTKIALIRTAGR